MTATSFLFLGIGFNHGSSKILATPTTTPFVLFRAMRIGDSVDVTVRRRAHSDNVSDRNFINQANKEKQHADVAPFRYLRSRRG